MAEEEFKAAFAKIKADLRHCLIMQAATIVVSLMILLKLFESGP
ncbi:hypothetical protein [Ensifer sp. SSB1]|nr:hypothetical protein [Ensifer sp. SSB1]